MFWLLPRVSGWAWHSWWPVTHLGSSTTVNVSKEWRGKILELNHSLPLWVWKPLINPQSHHQPVYIRIWYMYGHGQCIQCIIKRVYIWPCHGACYHPDLMSFCDNSLLLINYIFPHCSTRSIFHIVTVECAAPAPRARLPQTYGTLLGTEEGTLASRAFISLLRLGEF